MSAKKKARMPREAVTFNQLCAMPRDNVSTRDYWMMVEENRVHIYKQRAGHRATEHITLSKSAFNRLVDWYNTGKMRKPMRRRASTRTEESGTP